MVDRSVRDPDYVLRGMIHCAIGSRSSAFFAEQSFSHVYQTLATGHTIWSR
jgi:hypothetical protein